MTIARGRRALAPAAGGLLGAGFYLWIGGARLLNPLEFAWLMRLDWRIHFLGWHLFRGEPWQWPPGRIASYAYPDGTAIIFTDSIPLLAFLFKPFSAVLPTPFQYIGLWLFTCFVLQGVFGVLLTRVWTSNVSLQLVGALLFVLMPTLLIRVGHPSLCAHFLLLWPLWLYLRDPAVADRRRLIAACAAIGLCAGLLHPYLAVMAMLLLAALVLRERTVHAALAFVAASLALVFAWWASGLFTVSGAENLSSEGFGYYSMNLLSPMTPSGWSAFLPELPTATGGQAYEGFQYFGAGTLALAAVAAAIALRGRHWRWPPVAPIVLACALSASYALSPRVTLGSTVIVDWWSAELDRFALFRATGRFFWPLAYLVLTGAIGVVVTRLGKGRAAMVLVAATALQLADLRPPHAERRATSRSAEFHTWNNPLPSAAWHEILLHYDHLVLVPARQCGSAPIGFEAPAYLAGLHALTLNSAEVARFNEERRRAYCARLADDMAAGAVDPRSLYIVDAPHAAALRAKARTPVVCGVIDAARVCVTADSYAAWRHLAALE